MRTTTQIADAAPEEPVSPGAPARREVGTVAIVALLLVLVSARAIQWSLDHNLNSDFRNHAINAAVSNRLGIPWPHFLSYWVMSAPCGLCTTAKDVIGPLPWVVATFLAAKFAITYYLLRRGSGFRHRDYATSMAGILLLAAVAVLMGVAFSLPFPNLYRGQLPPNQFHNTTTIVVMPLALWTFWAACRFVRTPSRAGAVWIAVAGLLSVFAKPNFAMAFVPAFPVQLHFSAISRRWKIAGLVATGVIGVVLLGQYGYMYHSAEFARLRHAALAARFQPADAAWGLKISPFTLWREVSPAIPISLISTLLFPVAALLARPAAARKSRELRFAWLLFGFALLAFIMFAETGRVAGIANLRWGGIATMYILFTVSAAMLLEPRLGSEGGSRTRDVLAWIAFGLHVASGIFVLIVFAHTGTYLQLHWKQVFAHW